MNGINSNFSTPFFRNFAAAFSTPKGKTATGNEGNSQSIVSVVQDKFRDQLTLSQEGRSAYATYQDKLYKTKQTGQTTQTQTTEVADTDVESSSVPTSQDDLNAKHVESYNPPDHTKMDKEQFEQYLLERYKPVVVLGMEWGVRDSWTMDETGKWHANGGIKLVRTGDTGLTAEQQTRIDQVTLAKAYALWARDHDPGKCPLPDSITNVPEYSWEYEGNSRIYARFGTESQAVQFQFH
jgi:hypothetical protein